MEIGWWLEPDGCLTGETPASRSKYDTCDPLSYFGLQSVAAHIRVWCMQRRMVRCVHTVLPDEWNSAAIMILAVGYLLVNRIIQFTNRERVPRLLTSLQSKIPEGPEKLGSYSKTLQWLTVFHETTRPVRANDHQSFTVVWSSQEPPATAMPLFFERFWD